MKTWLVLLLLCSGMVQADWITAMQSYDNGDFATAKTEYEKLLPLANENAAFNLGVMAYRGEGQEADMAAALAYFKLAAALGHVQAEALVDRLLNETTPEQRRLADQLAKDWQAKVLIKNNAAAYYLSKEAAPAPLNTPMPKIPEVVARDNRFGYIVVRYLVDGEGKVQVADSVDSFPAGVYEYYTLNAVRRWQYEATGKPHLMTTQINYWVRGSMSKSQARQLLSNNDLWEWAKRGAPKHQETVGSLLNLIHIVSSTQLFVSDDIAEPDGVPDFTEWFAQTRLSFPVKEFVGYTNVKTNSKGEIVQVLNDRALQSPAAEQLLGERIRGATEGTYNLSRPSKRDSAVAQRYVPTHRHLTADYWWNEAAKNGDITAQRIMGAQREDWQFYLLQANDPIAGAWHGARLVLDGEKEEGLALLTRSAAAGYSAARGLLKALQ